MRLIDADALKAYAYESREWSHGGHPFVVEVDDIDDAPTIDPDDLRGKGEWRLNEDLQWACTNCEGLAIGHPNEPDWQALTDYCPNCGAKMGGGSGGK